MIYLGHLILWFIIYSFLGWVYETILCSVGQKRFVNRGFLNGPYCPVYGLGAVAVLLLLKNVNNPALLFLASIVATGSIEYFTAWLLESLFNAKWWDYSNRRFNIHGRVCMLGLVVFGALSVLMVKLIHPFVNFCINSLPNPWMLALAFILLTILLTDTVYTVAKFSKFNQKLRAIHLALNEIFESSGEYVEKTKAIIENTVNYNEIIEKIKSFTQKLNFQERRLLNAFPRFRPKQYNEVLQRVKEYIKSIKK